MERLPFELPDSLWALQEINLPEELWSLAGQTVQATVLPEEEAATRRVDPDDVPLWIDEEGNYWNDFRPVRVSFEHDGRTWRIPLRWLEIGLPESLIDPSAIAKLTGEGTVSETLNLPNEWNLWELNIPWDVSCRAAGKPAQMHVLHVPEGPPKVFWTAEGRTWRIPHDWRRRIVRLPDCAALMRESVPYRIAREFSGKAVAVNYHPGSLCCAPEHYRFRDANGCRWPVPIRDCVLLGLGDSVNVMRT
jgi:hypothetical protein